MSDTLGKLLDLLDLEQIELDIFRGRSPDDRRQRVFGGQVAGQALVAAGRTVPSDRAVHSLHAYFIRPGDPSVPLVYIVDRVRDGRSFTTRRVSAIQHGKVIFTLSASFHHPEPGPDHSARHAGGAAAGVRADAPGTAGKGMGPRGREVLQGQPDRPARRRARCPSRRNVIRPCAPTATWCGCAPTAKCLTTHCCTSA